MLNLKGAYPRWVCSGSIVYQPESSGDEQREIKSFLNIGDSIREANIGVAPNFPAEHLEDDEIIIPQSFSQYFGFINDNGDQLIEGTFQKLNLTFNMLDIIPDGQMIKDLLLTMVNKDDGGAGDVMASKLNLPGDLSLR